MDELDTNLLEAWYDVRQRLAKDPAARGRRYERGLRAVLRRPVRAWCVSVKASDTRIEHAAMADGDAVEAAACRERHGVVLFGELVRHMVRPVVIPWPGFRSDDAAYALGIDMRTMADWMDKGWVQSRREKVPGRRGLPSRFVWTGGGGIDVCFPQGRDLKWGSLWRGLWERVPMEFEQAVERVPRERGRGAEFPTPGDGTGSRRENAGGCESLRRCDDFRGRGDFRGNFRGNFRGWDWVCPGRELGDGVWAGCGRVCKKLVAPLPVWTVERMLPSSPEVLGGGRGLPVGVASYEPRVSRFACATCWNVQHTPTDPDAAWNQLVTAISGGLLYGREVARPRGWG